MLTVTLFMDILPTLQFKITSAKTSQVQYKSENPNDSINLFLISLRLSHALSLS